MNGQATKEGEDGNPVKIFSGGRYSVFLVGEALAAYRRLEKSKDANGVKAFAQIKRWMQIFCENGPEHIPNTHFKHEGTFKCGGKSGKKAAVYEFKGWQVRIYGIQTRHEDSGCFIGFHADLSKKRDKANRAKLEATASAAEPYL